MLEGNVRWTIDDKMPVPLSSQEAAPQPVQDEALPPNKFKERSKVRLRSFSSREAQWSAAELDMGKEYFILETFTNKKGHLELWIKDGPKDIGWIPAVDFEPV